MRPARRLISILMAILAVSFAAPAEPQLQPGLIEALCASRVPPDPDCLSIAYPAIDVWSVAAILPLREGEAATASYDSLIPPPFTPPPSGRREIAVLMFRLDLPMNPTSSIDTDPGAGYAEGSVAIRVGFPAAEGFPYSEGWWDLAQPLNDPSQYGAGRGVGLPKYMADASLRRLEDGTWAAAATGWGKADGQAGGPGSTTIEDGNVLTISWKPEELGPPGEHVEQVRAWGQYGEPLFVQTRPYDENVPTHDPAMVKFTPASLVPLYDVRRTPLTEFPDPIVGTATVRLEGAIPGPGSTITSMPFSAILEPVDHVVAGTIAFTRGYAFLTTDDLRNNTA
ncbi:MAG: hypothetical protein WEB06_04115 [Actinomycetota bacterium]